MRKLFLASFSFETGSITQSEVRLQSVDCTEESTREHINETALKEFNEWFLKEYPESTRLSYRLLPTIPHETDHVTESVKV